MNLKNRISKLEEKAGAKRPWSRVVGFVAHEHYPQEKLDAFLRANGVDLDDPDLLLIHHQIVEPDRDSKHMCEPRILN